MSVETKKLSVHTTKETRAQRRTEPDSPETPNVGDALLCFEESDYQACLPDDYQSTATTHSTKLTQQENESGEGQTTRNDTETKNTTSSSSSSSLQEERQDEREVTQEELLREYELGNPKERPADYDQLLWSEQTFEELMDIRYWLKICPHLHINSARLRALAEANVIPLDSDRLKQLKSDMNQEGFFEMDRKELPWKVSMSAIAHGVVRLMQYGWPPPFIMLFDEPWLLGHQVSEIVEKTTGNHSIMDWFAWYVDPALGGRGWPPHRDRAEADSSKAFREDGSPLYSTVWLPLTDAHPSNSCLYFLPAYADPGYKDSALDGQEMMDSVFGQDYGNYQDIRACPLTKGSILSFSGRLLHWGSRGKRTPTTPPVIPRIAVSFASSSDEFERPYISREYLPFPPLRLRLALVASQAIVYNRQEPLPKERMALYQRIFMSQHKHFDKTYIEKIEFLCQWFRFARVLERPPAQLKKGSNQQ